MVQVRVLPYHTEDVLVEVFSYLAEKIKYNPQLVFAIDASADDVERISRILEERAHDDDDPTG